MVFPTITAAHAALLALMYLGLSIWVIAGRATYTVNHGDGGNPAMLRRMRAHANFAEYVPFTLLLLALLEAHGFPQTPIRALLGTLIVARLMHLVGMREEVFSARQFALRGVGIILNLGVIGTTAVLLMLNAPGF